MLPVMRMQSCRIFSRQRSTSSANAAWSSCVCTRHSAGSSEMAKSDLNMRLHWFVLRPADAFACSKSYTDEAVLSVGIILEMFWGLEFLAKRTKEAKAAKNYFPFVSFA